MNTRKKVLGIARSVCSVLSVATAVAVPSANAQRSRVPPGSDSIAIAIVARALMAERGGPMPDHLHWIDEMQIGEAPPIRTEVFMAGRDRILVRGSVLGQVTLEFGSNGTTGWSFTPETGVVTVTGPELAAMRESIRMPFGAPLDASDLRFVHGGKVMLEGEFTDLVLMIDAKGDTTERYYAVSTGLLSALSTPVERGRRGRSITFYRDYTRVGAEQIPALKTALLRNGTKMVTRLVYASTDSIPDEKFRRPAAPTAP
jgi:hypothetical protein